MKRWAALLAVWPVAAAEVRLVPSEFFVSPGEAVTVQIEGEGIAPGQLRDAVLITASSVYNITSLRSEGGAVAGRAVVKGAGVEILAVRTASGREFAKALLVSETPDDTWKKHAGHAIEIVPLKNPFAIMPGEELPIEVLFRGKPAAGASIRWTGGAGRALLQTDAAGKAAAKIAPGRWRIDVSFEDGGGSYRSSLVFEVR